MLLACDPLSATRDRIRRSEAAWWRGSFRPHRQRICSRRPRSTTGSTPPPHYNAGALTDADAGLSESRSLAIYLNESRADTRFTAALAPTELVRVVGRQESIDSVAHARRVLGRLDLVPLTNRLLDAAATMMPSELRTLDAVHLAAALTAPDLRSIVTYDNRLAEAAVAVGTAVVTPR